MGFFKNFSLKVFKFQKYFTKVRIIIVSSSRMLLIYVKFILNIYYKRACETGQGKLQIKRRKIYYGAAAVSKSIFENRSVEFCPEEVAFVVEPELNIAGELDFEAVVLPVNLDNRSLCIVLLHIFVDTGGDSGSRYCAASDFYFLQGTVVVEVNFDAVGEPYFIVGRMQNAFVKFDDGNLSLWKVFFDIFA